MNRSDLDEYGKNGSLRRREFLKLTGGGILVAVSVGDLATLPQDARRRGPTYPEDFNAYLRIAEDGRVACYTGKIEMGQGAVTSLAQIAADELDVPLSGVDMVMGDTDLCPWDMGTFGSQTTRNFGPALRAAAAEARAVLAELAAEKLHVPRERLAVKDGVIFDTARPDLKASYAELAAGKRIERRAIPKPSPKDVAEWKVMGRPEFHRDALDKVTGRAVFSGDLRLPGMLYARILRPPAHDAELKNLNTSDAEALEGVRVIRDENLVAVLHEYPDVAEDGLGRVKAEYQIPPSELDDKTIFEHLLKTAPEGRTIAQGGDLRQGEALATSIIKETYLNSYVAHAPMETHTALAEFKDGRMTVWASTQTPFRLKDELVQTLGMAPENVHVMTPLVGGGFGGKTRNTQAVQAARLARLTGRPVQVAWSRADEFFYDTFRPAAVVKVTSAVDAAGRIVLWDYAVAFAGERSAAQFYDIPHHRTVVKGEWGGGRTGGGPAAHPFAVGAWRAPASNTNAFARECQVDIMASRAGRDPLEFRLMNLNDPRMKRVLETAAARFGWTPARSPSGRGYGLACENYLGTYVATAAEVRVNKERGTVQAVRVVCAQDMGQIINPQGARIQIEGCIMMGLGYSLTEEIHFRGGRILDLNFDSYHIPRFSWMPKIEAVLVENTALPASGGGEPAIVTMGAVLANALHDATGARLFQLPMTPARVKEALIRTGTRRSGQGRE